MASAQTPQIGVGFGNFWQAQEGQGMLDSVSYSLASGKDNIAIWGIHGKYDINQWLYLRTALTGHANFVQVLLQNDLEECLGCPNLHNYLIRYNSGQISITPGLKIPLGNAIQVTAFAGATLNVHFPQYPPFDPYVSVNRQVFEVTRKLENALRLTTFSYTYGAGLELWRFSLVGQLSSTIGNSMFRTITFQDEDRILFSQANYLHLMLYYSFDLPTAGNSK